MRSRSQFAVIFGVWLAIAVLVSIQIDLAARLSGHPQVLAQILPGSLLWCAIWALLTPSTVWLAGRFKLLQGQAKFRNLAIHVAAAALTAAVHATLFAGLDSLMTHAGADLSKTIQLSGSLQFNLLIYMVIVGLVELGGNYTALRDREIADTRLMAQLVETQNAALRAQLQPHFLFNALNTIAAYAHDDPVRTVRMIARLGELLRLSMDAPHGQWTTLADELAFADAYLAIESERLGDRLRIVRDIAPEALDAKLLSVLLQPLVENAVRHGLGPRARGGELRLEARIRGDRLCLTIADDGVGTADIVEGVGLRNTRLRLAQLYPERHSFVIDSQPGQGFTVRIELPHDPNPDH